MGIIDLMVPGYSSIVKTGTYTMGRNVTNWLIALGLSGSSPTAIHSVGCLGSIRHATAPGECRSSWTETARVRLSLPR